MPFYYKLDDLKEVTNAYYEFTTVEDSMLSPYYKGIVPHYCKCGAEVILTQEFSQLQCCNPCCWVKWAHRFAFFAKTLGYKGIGKANSLTLFTRVHDKLEHATFLSVFNLPAGVIVDAVGPGFESIFTGMKQDLLTRPVPFADAMVALGINGLGNRSRLWEAVRDPVSYLHFTLTGELERICNELGIQARQTRFALKEAKVDVVYLMKYVIPNIISMPQHEIKVMITGTVTVDGKPYTREGFINLCESLLDEHGRPAFQISMTGSKSAVEYVIADFPSDTSKYRLGKEMGIIVPAQGFFDMLKKRLGGESQDDTEE